MRRLLVLLAFLVLALPSSAAAALRVADVQTAEGGVLVFTVERTVPTDGGTAGTADAGATAPADYTPVAGQELTFTDDRAEVRVQTAQDAVAEPTEEVRLEIDGSFLTADVQATGRIEDLRVSAEAAAGDEAAGTDFVVRATAPVARAVAVRAMPAPGTATAGDFAAGPVTVTIPSGAATATGRVPFADDDVDEDDESLTVALESADGAAVAGAPASITIRNDDLRTLSVGDATVVEGDAPGAVARIPVTLSGGTFRRVSVQFTTLDAFARAPRDFLSRFDTLTFAPNQTSAFVEVAISADRVQEAPETFGLLIGKAEGARIAREAGVVTITDDDGPAADDTPPNLRVRAPQMRGPVATVRVGCPRNEQRCSGRVTLFTVAERRSAVKLLRTERRLGTGRFSVAGGREATVRVRVPRTLAAAGRRAGRLKVRAYAVTQDANRNTDTTAQTGTLRFRR